ncbi:MAG: ATP-binding cassette domain-containing protein [Rhizobiales bacterium]|nr:ATP-binding cassette domain-containing protein [Hyphomicrobiales bacterium]
MTFQPGNMTGNAPAQSSVHEMQQRVLSAFGGEEVEKTSKVFERLRKGMVAGEICGKPLADAEAACLVELLERLGWVPSIELFIQAMPHFPEDFGVTDLREVCGRLGFTSEETILNANEIEQGLLPGLVLDIGPNPMIIDHELATGLVLIDPLSGQKQPLHSTKKLKLVLFRPIAAKDPNGMNKSWFGVLRRHFNKTFLLLLGLTFLINMMVIATSLTVMAIYDSVLPAGAMDTLAAIVFGVAVAFLCELWLRRVRARTIGYLAARLEYLISSSIFAKLIALPLDMVANVPVGSQIARLKQFETIRDLVTGALVTVGLEIPFVFLFIGFLFLMGGPLGFVPVALIGVYALVALLMFPIVRRLSAEASHERSEQYRLVLDTLSNLRTIRSLGCEEFWLARISDGSVKLSRAKRNAREANRILSTLSSAAVPLTGGATVFLGALMVMDQTLTVGSLIACMIVVWRIITPVQQGMLLLSGYADLSRQVSQLDRLMAMPDEVGIEDHTVHKTLVGALGFERLTFRYRDTIEPSLLGVQLDIGAGELVAIGGSSGAGKTTFLRMILNLYQPQSGAVTIDGKNIRQIPVSAIRSAIGYVPQTPSSFHGTIAQNLRLAAPAASDTELHELAAEFGVLESILELPNGFDSHLHEFEQMRMAQGLMQVLSLMQALLRRPAILLLDEPAKSLDPVLEQAFLKVLERLRGKTTTIMVTHRPSHMRMADRVIIFDRGQVVQNGPPQPEEQKVPA